jgi:ureidoacrylate peracid hydrolase
MAADPISFGQDFFTFEPAKTALIVIDMQNSFVAEGGTYETPPARDMIPRLERLIAFAREHEMPIVWTQSDHSAPHSGIMLKKFPPIRDDRELWKGETSFDLYTAMVQPAPGEFRVVKHKYDAFWETDLDAILRNSEVETVIIVGTATNVCCESTARSAFFRDYQVVFLSDCTASFDPDMHAAALKTIDVFFGRVMTSDEALAEMQEQHEASAVAAVT